jgi:Fic family protein
MKNKLNIIPVEIVKPYLSKVDKNVKQAFEKLHDSELSKSSFSFYTSVSAVFSSKIEGEHIELDSYINHKRFGIKFLPDYTRKTDDLYNAYQFAKKTKLSQKNMEQAHALLTKHILPKTRQGRVRTGNMFVTTPEGHIEYVAATSFVVAGELKKFYTDLKILMNTKLNFNEVLFYASMLHLIFVKIHPFDDGNGRTARLLEKWFIAQKLGTKAWFIQSEKYYYGKHNTYYKNLRALGIEYPELDYKKALPFLLMLPKSL